MISSLRVVHQDNSQAQHYARSGGNEYSTMYLTPFVYQFFVYNSLYQVDWVESFRTSELVTLNEREEVPKQDAFESFLAGRATPSALVSAFHGVPWLKGDEWWAKVVPDPLIGPERGKKFFADFRQFQSRLRRMRNVADPSSLLGETFRYIRELRLFIYAVRCNIFHGRKSLADATEPGQNERIRVYFQFLNGLVTLFFAVTGDKPNKPLQRTLGASTPRSVDANPGPQRR
jgi:hypothetical protein